MHTHTDSMYRISTACKGLVILGRNGLLCDTKLPFELAFESHCKTIATSDTYLKF